tara:strand:- start:6687 stop:7619 length:933 start_codon:yes stop_codon:yes gene_type:complete
VASSWNTGKLVETAVNAAVESGTKAVQEGPSFFDTVVNSASQAMASGAEVVADAAEAAYELVPESTDIKESVSSMVSRIPEPNIPTFNVDQKPQEKKTDNNLPVLNPSSLIPSPEVLSTVAIPVLDFFSPVLPVNASKFAEFMNNNGKINLTVDDFTPADVSVIKSAAKKVLDEGRSKFTYEDWGFEEKSVLMKDITTMATGTVTSPEFRMATLIGQTADGNVFLNEQGELIVRDVYDFNTGPLGTKLQQALVHKEAGNMDKYRELSTEVLTDENGDPRPYLQRLRIWAAALGVPEGQGTSWEINLGKLD